MNVPNHPLDPPASRRSARQASALAVVFATALLAAACGGDDEPATGVASLSDDEQAASAATDAGDDESDTDAQQAALDFAQCLRDNGLDVPDPTFDAEGNLAGGLFGGPDVDIDPGSPEAQTAFDACADLLESVPFGPGGEGASFDVEEIQATLADFTACLRDEGLDVGDLDLGRPGGIGGPGDQSTGGPADDGPAGEDPPDGGTPEGGDPSTALAEALGLDPDDEAVQAAIESCQPILESTFQGDTGDANGG